MFEKKYFVIGLVLACVFLLSNVSAVYSSIGLADYDSGWISMDCDERIFLEHRLGTTEVFVYMIGRNPDCAGWTGAHQSNFGSDNAMGRMTGAHWDNLTSNTIRIVRGWNDDTVDINWKEIRVQIWKIEPLPVDKNQLVAPWIAVALLTTTIAMLLIYIKNKKKQQS